MKGAGLHGAQTDVLALAHAVGNREFCRLLAEGRRLPLASPRNAGAMSSSRRRSDAGRAPAVQRVVDYADDHSWAAATLPPDRMAAYLQQVQGGQPAPNVVPYKSLYERLDARSTTRVTIVEGGLASGSRAHFTPIAAPAGNYSGEIHIDPTQPASPFDTRDLVAQFTHELQHATDFAQGQMPLNALGQTAPVDYLKSEFRAWAAEAAAALVLAFGGEYQRSSGSLLTQIGNLGSRITVELRTLAQEFQSMASHAPHGGAGAAFDHAQLGVTSSTSVFVLRTIGYLNKYGIAQTPHGSLGPADAVNWIRGTGAVALTEAVDLFNARKPRAV